MPGFHSTVGVVVLLGDTPAITGHSKVSVALIGVVKPVSVSWLGSTAILLVKETPLLQMQTRSGVKRLHAGRLKQPDNVKCCLDPTIYKHHYFML